MGAARPLTAALRDDRADPRTSLQSFMREARARSRLGGAARYRNLAGDIAVRPWNEMRMPSRRCLAASLRSRSAGRTNSPPPVRSSGVLSQGPGRIDENRGPVALRRPDSPLRRAGNERETHDGPRVGSSRSPPISSSPSCSRPRSRPVPAPHHCRRPTRLGKTIGELMLATETAERAIAGLRTTSDCDRPG
jgi:hypothetical protein